MKRCPDDYLSRWFSVLHRLSVSYIYHGLKELKIGSGQILFLLELYYDDGVSQEELSSYLNIDGANTARAIKKLEQEGYIVREKDPQDRRAYKIYLTDQAIKIKPKIFELISNWEATLTQDLTRREQVDFARLLKRVGHTVADDLRCTTCKTECD